MRAKRGLGLHYNRRPHKNSYARPPLFTYTTIKEASNCSIICRCTAFSYLEGDPELAFFAVYDGHGGTGVANYLKDHLHEFILDQPEYKEGNMEESVLKASLQVSTRHCLFYVYDTYTYYLAMDKINYTYAVCNCTHVLCFH